MGLGGWGTGPPWPRVKGKAWAVFDKFEYDGVSKAEEYIYGWTDENPLRLAEAEAQAEPETEEDSAESEAESDV